MVDEILFVLFLFFIAPPVMIIVIALTATISGGVVYFWAWLGLQIYNWLTGQNLKM